MRDAEIEALKAALAGRPEILFAILYGSAAEGDEYSDLDVALFINPALLSGLDELHYSFRVESELRKVVDHPVDVRVVNRAPPAFRFNVIRGLPIVVHDEEAYHGFRERSWSEYLNLEPLYRAYFREML
jgi:predicted nucleotidyltransferase